MSDRVLIFSDLHIHAHNNDWRRVEDALEVLDWILKVSLERDIPKIYFLGDWFHVRGFMYPSVVAKTYEKLLKFKEHNREMYLLTGNHDMPYKNTTKHNTITVYNSIFPVIEQPMVEVGNKYNFYFLPYVENLSQLRWAINEIKSRGQEEQKTPTFPLSQNVLLAHLDITKAIFANNTLSTHGIEKEEVEDFFDLIITGHYHKHQKLGEKIWYVGSPYQQNFSEADSNKGIMIFDDGKLEFIENTFSPKYLYIKPDEIDWRIEGNYVKILADKVDNISALREKALEYNPRSLSVTLGRNANEVNVEPQLVNTVSKDIYSLIENWVKLNANESIYDQKKLISLGNTIVRNVKGA